jgi:hypothetical protein
MAAGLVDKSSAGIGSTARGSFLGTAAMPPGRD